MPPLIFVLGGDGFCGWPTALYLSRKGYEITIIDNLSRRKIDIDLGTQSLTPIAPMEQRLQAWRQLTGRGIDFVHLDVATEYDRLRSLVLEQKPQAIIHFAEQRAAPYSMRNAACKRYTVDNNLRGTHNVLCAIVESGQDIHLVHLGSMGVYGYGTAGMRIPEGYLPVTMQKDDGSSIQREILYPPNPGSVYHMTKTQDALFFYFYNKNNGIRITDLHQGIVWGTATEETNLDERLINRFDFDGDYGTVLNRFLLQSVVGHPLTVHGTGGQTRAFIHIRDTVQCLRLALENPPESGERVKIFNQATETHTIRQLAHLVAAQTGCEIRYYQDPRNEDLENSLCVESRRFRELGLSPVCLSDGLLEEVRDVVKKYRHRCRTEKIICTSLWSSKQTVDFEGSVCPVDQSRKKEG